MSRGAWQTTPDEDALHERRRARTRKLVRRSMLFVPTNVPRFVEKAHLRGADAIILDLEDSIPDREKVASRGLLAAAAAQVSRNGADVLVRVNKPLELIVGDLDAVVAARANGIVFPKAENAEELAILDVLLFERELAAGLAPGSIDVKISIESAAAFYALSGIVERCRRIERVIGISYGAEDVTVELGIESTAEGWERFLGSAQSVLAAASAGIAAFGRLGSPFNFGAPAEYENGIKRSASFGFVGASCIHPTQVDIHNRCFTPSAQRVANAHEVVAAMEAALAAGRASTSVGGKMVDIPSLRRATELLERVAAIEAKDARKGAALA